MENVEDIWKRQEHRGIEAWFHKILLGGFCPPPHELKIAKFKLPERLKLLDALPLTHVGESEQERIKKNLCRKAQP